MARALHTDMRRKCPKGQDFELCIAQKRAMFRHYTSSDARNPKSEIVDSPRNGRLFTKS